MSAGSRIKRRKMMENTTLREPVELTASELDEVAGGNGGCGCDNDGLINVEGNTVIVVVNL
jgi:hypothetical protein